MALEPPPIQASQRVGEVAFGFLKLPADFLSDDALEITNHGRIGMRASGGADNPTMGFAAFETHVAQGFVHGIFQSG